MRITGMPKQGEHLVTLDAGEFHALKRLLKIEQDPKQLEFAGVSLGGDKVQLGERRKKERRIIEDGRRLHKDRRES